MKILNLHQVSCRPNDVVFGASATRMAMWAIFAVGLLAATGYLFVVGRIGHIQIPRLWSGGLSLFSLLMLWLTCSTWRAALRPSNWVLRIQEDGVLIKYRNFENWRMSDDDPQVIALKASEIKFVRKAVRRQISTSMDGKGVAAATRVDLEIGLKNSDTTELEKALNDEAARPGYGSTRHQAKWLDNLVDIADQSVIRIAWKAGTGTIRPSINRAIAALTQIASVEETQKTVQDFTAGGLKQLAAHEQKQKIKELAGRDRIQAIATARMLYDCSQAEAMQIVDDSIASS